MITPEQAARRIQQVVLYDHVVISSSSRPGVISRVCPVGSRLAQRMERHRPDLIVGVYDRHVTAEEIVEDLEAVPRKKGRNDFPLPDKRKKQGGVMSSGLRIGDIPRWLCQGHCNSWSPKKERCNARRETHCDHPSAGWAVKWEREKERKRQDKGAS